MKVERQDKGIEIFLTWGEAEAFKKELTFITEEVTYDNNGDLMENSLDVHSRLEEIFIKEGT